MIRKSHKKGGDYFHIHRPIHVPWKEPYKKILREEWGELYAIP